MEKMHVARIETSAGRDDHCELSARDPRADKMSPSTWYFHVVKVIGRFRDYFWGL